MEDREEIGTDFRSGVSEKQMSPRTTIQILFLWIQRLFHSSWSLKSRATVITVPPSLWAGQA